MQAGPGPVLASNDMSLALVALAIVKDTRSGSPMWGSNNSVSNMSDVRFMFGNWARQIRARLDIVHGY